MTSGPTDPIAVVAPLPYADEVERLGVTAQRTSFGLRVVVPPLPSWRHLPRGYFIAIAILGFATVFPLAEGIALQQLDPSLVIPALEFGIPTGLVTLYAWQLMKRRTVLDVTRDELAISFIAPSGRARRASWPRAGQPTVNASDINGKLIVRCRGMDPAEIYLGPSGAVLHSVAAAVDEALAADLAPAPAGAFPRVGRTAPATGVANGFLAALVVLVCLAAIVLPFNPRMGFVMLLIVLALLVPYAGITRGTQDKEFWA